MDHRCVLWSMVLAVCVTLHACAKDTVTQAPAIIRVLTEETPPTGRAGDAVERAGRRLASDATLLEPVVRVASRLIATARRSEFGPRARALCWVIAIYDDNLPAPSFVRSDGGITMSSGAFRLAQSEAGLAALLSHELIHALVHESAVVSPSCLNTTSGQPPSLFTHGEELQADELGLKLMAEAGYDPRELLELWERMKRRNDDISDEVLVHLTYDRRMEQIAQWLPDALTRYERANRAPQKALPSK
jgi:predicted Zn-dependent protease